MFYLSLVPSNLIYTADHKHDMEVRCTDCSWCFPHKHYEIYVFLIWFLSRAMLFLKVSEYKFFLVLFKSAVYLLL